MSSAVERLSEFINTLDVTNRKNYKEKNSAIGGSEVISFFPFKKEKITPGTKNSCTYTKIKEKNNIIERNNFTSKAAAHGIFFESAVVHIMQDYFRTTIIDGKDCKNLRHAEGPLGAFCYYPDGLFLKDDKISIIEIKCPSKIEKTLTVQDIKRGYKEQLLLGLEILYATGSEPNPSVHFTEAWIDEITEEEFLGRSDPRTLYGFTEVTVDLKGRPKFLCNLIGFPAEHFTTHGDSLEHRVMTATNKVRVFWKVNSISVFPIYRDDLIEHEGILGQTWIVPGNMFGDKEFENVSKIYKFILSDIKFKQKLFDLSETAKESIFDDCMNYLYDTFIEGVDLTKDDVVLDEDKMNEYLDNRIATNTDVEIDYFNYYD